MPIKKETSARLVKEKIPYEIISRHVVQSITNPIGLALYTYLISLPEHWIVRRKHLIDHFDGLGRERYDAGMAQLKSLGLVWVMDARNELGQITDKVIMVEALPKVGKPTIRENPQLGKTDHIEIQTVIRDTDISLSKGFKRPTVDEVTDYCNEKGYTIDPETFINHYNSNGWKVGRTSMKCWKSACTNWQKREKKPSKSYNRPDTSTRQTSLQDDLTDTSWAN